MKFFARIALFPLITALAAAGCGGQFGESVSVPQTKEHRLAGGFAGGGRLSVPGDLQLVIADAQRHSTGTARSESAAAATGEASCSAAADADGEAWAEFQLGHVLHNDSDQSIEATVTFDVEYEYAISTRQSIKPGPPPAQLALKLYIRDSNKKILHRLMLAEQSDRLGAQQFAGRQSPTFTVTLEPHLAYQLVLAGRTEVAIKPDGDDTAAAEPLSARIEVKRLGIEVVGRPAATAEVGGG